MIAEPVVPMVVGIKDANHWLGCDRLDDSDGHLADLH